MARGGRISPGLRSRRSFAAQAKLRWRNARLRGLSCCWTEAAQLTCNSFPLCGSVCRGMSTKCLVIVGRVVGGASAAARARRLSEEAEIIVFERGPHVSFANCDLPYYLTP